MIEWNGKCEFPEVFRSLMQREKFDYVLVARTDAGLEVYMSSEDPVINGGLLNFAVESHGSKMRKIFVANEIHVSSPIGGSGQSNGSVN